ncbi:MAG: hypothetical protein ABUL71_04415, partial [Gemmatimonadota bacterium]
MDALLRERISALCAEGWEIFERFEAQVRDHEFHPFVAADYDGVLAALLRHRSPGATFLEWGSATGVITIMAEMLGFNACGIELDADLVGVARSLATRFDSRAQFAAGSFVPAGYVWRPSGGDGRIATIGDGASGYRELGRSLDDFDIVFGYPWRGEEPMMRDLMSRYGRSDALLLLNTVNGGVEEHRNA